MKPCLQPCLNTESSQQHQLVGEHSLRPPSTCSNGRAQSIALPNQSPTSGATLPGNTASVPQTGTKGNCRAQLMAPCNHGAQPATLPSQGAHSAALLKHGAQSTHPTTKPSYWESPILTSEHTQLESLTASPACPWTLLVDTSNNPS